MDKVIDRAHYFLLIVIVLVWGLSWPANKEGLTAIPPLWFASLRLIVGTVAMFIIVFCLKKLVIPTRKDLPLIFTLGIFQIGLFILLINLGLRTQSTGASAVLVYTTPLWVMPMAIFFFKEPNILLKWVGFILGLGGVIIMLNPWAVNWSNHDEQLSILFLIGASLSLAISMLCARYMTWYSTPLELISWQLLLAAIVVSIIACIFQPHPNLHWNVMPTICLFYTAIFATALGFLGMTKLSKELPSSITSVGFLGVPISGVVFSVLFLHEKLPISMVIAMICIILGIICVLLGEKSK